MGLSQVSAYHLNPRGLVMTMTGGSLATGAARTHSRAASDVRRGSAAAGRVDDYAAGCADDDANIPRTGSALWNKILDLDDQLPPKKYQFRDGSTGGKCYAIAKLLGVCESVVDAVISLDRQEARREVAAARTGLQYLRNLMVEARAARADIFDPRLVERAEMA